MQFTESETIKNLAKSYAGESQAGLKYQFISQLCTQMGYKTLADELKAIAKNETNHAKVFYDFIVDNTENGISVEFCADYSFSKNEILEGIKSAIQTEYNEAENIYPAFAQIAVNEGFKEIAEKFSLIAKVELRHKARFEYIYNALNKDTLFRGKKPTMWECSNCGHVATLIEAWDVCPLCGANQGFVKLLLP